ncbi:MAG: hypothetical protein ABIF82_07335 [Planctomycetota bacterium]
MEVIRERTDGGLICKVVLDGVAAGAAVAAVLDEADRRGASPRSVAEAE